MRNIKFVLSFLSYCLFFMVQVVNAQYNGYENDLKIVVYCKGISDPSHISTLDFCDVELINKNGPLYYCPIVSMGNGQVIFILCKKSLMLKIKSKVTF